MVPKRGAPLLTDRRRTVHVLVSREGAARKFAHQVTLIAATAENGRLIHIRRSHSR